MTTLVRELFAAPPAKRAPGVKVSGWVRTMRESKAFAFVELNDGSYFKNLQIVLEADKLENYHELTKKIGVGAAIEAEGELVPTPEMKQPFELKATALTVLGESPSDYPLQKKAPHAGIPSHHTAFAAARQPLPVRLPRALAGGAGHPPLLPRSRLCLRTHPHPHRQRLRGCGRDVPRHHAGTRAKPPRLPDGKRGL